MRRKSITLTIAVALTVILSVTGCGAENNNIVATQKETAVSTKSGKTESKKDIKETLENSADKTEEAGQGETEVKTEDTQETVVADNKADTVNSSSNVEAGSDSGSNSNSTSGKNNTTASTNGRTTTANTGNNTATSTATNTNNSTGNNSNNSTQTSTPTPAQHQHTWVHVEATGHNETVVVQAAWDEQVPVYGNVEHSICNTCGADITGHSIEHLENSLECGGYHSVWKYEQTGTQTIHHDAVTEQRWVQDASAYDVCSGCGVTR